MVDVDRLRELARRIADRAGPGEQLEVYVSASESTAARAHGGEVESFTRASTAAIGIRVVAGDRQGFASAGSFDDDVIEATLADARDNARFAEVDEDHGLAEPDGWPEPDLERWCDALGQMTTDHRIGIALELERIAVGADPRVYGVRTAVYRDAASARAIATSTGIDAADRATSCSVSVVALARDGRDTTTGAGVHAARDPAELEVEEAGRDAAARAVAVLGAHQPASERLTVVLEPRLAAALVELVGAALAAEAVLKGRTPFADRLGEQIAAPVLSVTEDPTDGRSLGATRHDGEGLATRQVDLIAGGVLKRFLHNTYTARRLGTATTASAQRGARSTPGTGASALAVAPGTRGPGELLAGVDRGVFVQSLTGLHSGVNLVSGDLSVGIEGRAIRGGELGAPLREATLASSIPRLLANIAAVGADRQWQPGGTGAATLVIEDMTLSGR